MLAMMQAPRAAIGPEGLRAAVYARDGRRMLREGELDPKAAARAAAFAERMIVGDLDSSTSPACPRATPRVRGIPAAAPVPAA